MSSFNFLVGSGIGSHSLGWSSNAGSNWTGVTGANQIMAYSWASYYNGELWVAGGLNFGNFSIATSVDGKNWTGNQSGTNIIEQVQAVFFANGKWYAGGFSWNGQVLMTSTDGLTWTNINVTNLCNRVTGFATNGTRVIASTHGTFTVIYSDNNGATWQGAENNNNILNQGYYAHYANGIFMAGGFGIYRLIKSTNGINWTQCGDLFIRISYSTNGIAFNGSRWVVVGNSDSQVQIAYSDNNGDNWTRVTTFTYSGQAKCIFWNGTVFVVGLTDQSSPRCLISSDGITWTVSTSANTVFTTHLMGIRGASLLGASDGGGAPPFNGPYEPATSNPTSPVTDAFTIAVGGSNNTISYSLDGLTYYPSGNPFSDNGGYAYETAWNGTIWLAGGGYLSQNNIVYSTDGLTWTQSVSSKTVFGSANGYVGGLCWNGSLWVAGGQNAGVAVIATSSNGSNWVKQDNHPGNIQNVNKIAWNGTCFIATCRGSSGLLRSTDGSNWFAVGSGVFNQSIAYGIESDGVMFVATGRGSNNTIAYSTDGNTWTGCGATLSRFNYGTDVGYNGTQWIAVTDSTDSNGVLLATSSDGSNWSYHGTGPFGSNINDGGYSVTWNGTHWIVGGYKTGSTTRIWTSTDGSNFSTVASASNFTDGVYGVASQSTLPFPRCIIAAPSAITASSSNLSWSIATPTSYHTRGGTVGFTLHTVTNEIYSSALGITVATTTSGSNTLGSIALSNLPFGTNTYAVKSVVTGGTGISSGFTTMTSNVTVPLLAPTIVGVNNGVLSWTLPEPSAGRLAGRTINFTLHTRSNSSLSSALNISITKATSGGVITGSVNVSNLLIGTFSYSVRTTLTGGISSPAADVADPITVSVADIPGEIPFTNLFTNLLTNVTAGTMTKEELKTTLVDTIAKLDSAVTKIPALDVTSLVETLAPGISAADLQGKDVVVVAPSTSASTPAVIPTSTVSEGNLLYLPFSSGVPNYIQLGNDVYEVIYTTGESTFSINGTLYALGASFPLGVRMYTLLGLGGATMLAGSQTSGTATPQKLSYDQIVHVDLSANAINLADASVYGHRVTINVPFMDLNNTTRWSRLANDLAPAGTLKQPDFTNLLLTRLPFGFTDLDRQANGLSFSSSDLDDVTDTRLRKTPGVYSVNDWVMAYVLFKLYGNTNITTINEIFNIEDVQNMLENTKVTTAIATNLSNPQNAESVQKLFRDLLISDPKRFFDASGYQIEGLFETNPIGSDREGTWLIVPNDVIEIRLEFEFKEAITRRNVADSQLSTPGATREISAGEKFAIRLQVTAV
jgi:hypothetical protein